MLCKLLFTTFRQEFAGGNSFEPLSIVRALKRVNERVANQVGDEKKPDHSMNKEQAIAAIYNGVSVDSG